MGAETSALAGSGQIIDDPDTQLSIVQTKLADLGTALRYSQSDTEKYAQYLELRSAFEHYRELDREKKKNGGRS